MSAFIIKVKTDNAGTSNNDQFTLPGNSSYSYNFDVDWGDGSPVETINSGSSWTHTFTGGAGTYSVEITENVAGGFPTIRFNNGGDRLKLLEIEQWGTNRWDAFNESFYGCSNLTITATDEATADTGGVANFRGGWLNCSSLISFPLIDTSSGEEFGACWRGCSSLVSFPLINTSNGTSFATPFSGAWQDCSSLTSFPLIDTSNGTTFQRAWQGCSSLTSFPLLDTSSGTNFSGAWYNCSSLTSFPLIDTSSGTNFGYAWSNCSSLTSFPLIDTSSGTSFQSAWLNCSSLTSFPLLDTSSGTDFRETWRGCSSLTSFPLIDTSSGTNFFGTWLSCNSLTSFPLIDTSSGANFQAAWYNCSSLTSFPFLVTSSGTSFREAWLNCSSLTSFPLIDTSSGTSFRDAWLNCSSLTSFPLIDTSSGTRFTSAWRNCSSLTSFPLIDTSSGTGFRDAWNGCSSLTSFPLIDTSSGANFQSAWQGCSSLTSFPTLDFRAMSNGLNTFLSVTLDTASYDSILEKSFLNNTNNGVTFNGGNSTYFKRGKKQRDILTAAPRNWTITDGGYDATHVYPDWKDGLQGWWCPSLDTAGNGTTTLTDLSGNGNNGTLTNMDAATDWVADTDNGGVRALDLDGGDDLIVVANNPGAFASGQSFSVAGWIKSTMTGVANTTALIGDGYSPIEDRPWWLLYLNGNGTAGLYLRTSPPAVSKFALGGTFNDGAWHQITSVYNATAGTIETWVDGVSVATATSVPQDAYGTNSQDTVIGDVLGRSLDASIDGIAIWDRILTADEVTQLYNGGRSLNLLAGGTSIVPQLLLCRRCRSPIL